MYRSREIITNKPDLILTADWHLREDQPICRIDNFWEVQWEKVDFISGLQVKYGCPIIHSGDLFNHWKPSPFLLSETIKHLPNQFYTIYGNHDLPQHNLELAGKCGVNVLLNAGKLSVLEQCHWGNVPTNYWEERPEDADDLLSIKQKGILVWHVMTYTSKPWPGCTDPLAESLLRKYPQYDLIVTGHNHQTFWTKYEDRLLVNPGSITRQEAGQIDFKPRVYLWYAETNTVTPVYLPISQNVITTEHIDSVKKRDDRISAFVEQLKNEWKVGLSFEQNLEAFSKENNIEPEIMNIIYKAIESNGKNS